MLESEGKETWGERTVRLVSLYSVGLWESEWGWRVGKELEGCAGGEDGDVRRAGLEGIG